MQNYKAMKELIEIQQKLKAPKGQFNNFGKYKYRSCEDILEALKPLLYEYKCQLTLKDELIYVGTRYYIKATATIMNGQGHEVSTTALAREEEAKKGMDGSQITGTSSSYARKYALNGLFCIDDTKDSDCTNKSDGGTKSSQSNAVNDDCLYLAMQDVNNCVSIKSLQATWETYSDLQSNKEFIRTVNAKKKELK